jgi:post-segregation antitoxin (ccd killing protein)
MKKIEYFKMKSKKKTSISLDENLLTILRKKKINISGYINFLIKKDLKNRK